MSQHRGLVAVMASLFVLGLGSGSATAASDGYHYDRPAPPPSVHSGHYFAPLATVAPLPPVPGLPPLPTGHPGERVHSQSLLQLHPPPPAAHVQPPPILAPAYLPPSPTPIVSQIAKTYLPAQSQGQYNPHFSQPQLQPQPQPQHQSLSTFFGSSGPSGPGTNAQPLRVPYGKQAIIHYPDNDPQRFYSINGRQLKQYAVVEIIDNDIEHVAQPFLTPNFFDSYRAQIGASGTGATAPSVAGIQLPSRSNALVLEQQRLAAQRAVQPAPNDAVALGSGSLGYIRLPNGNIYLGSGSLGYVSGQQRQSQVRDARTRSGAMHADPLHFGHGPLGDPENLFRFK